MFKIWYHTHVKITWCEISIESRVYDKTSSIDKSYIKISKFNTETPSLVKYCDKNWGRFFVAYIIYCCIILSAST